MIDQITTIKALRRLKKHLWDLTKTKAQWRPYLNNPKCIHFQILGHAPLDKDYGTALNLPRELFSDSFWAHLEMIYNRTSTKHVPSLHPDSEEMYAPALMGKTLYRRIRVKIPDGHNKKWFIFTFKSKKLTTFFRYYAQTN